MPTDCKGAAIVTYSRREENYLEQRRAVCPGEPMSDKKKAKGKSQNFPKRARKPRTSQMKTAGQNRSKKQSGQAVAISTRVRDPMEFSEGPVFHKKYGRGMRFTGRQMVTNLVTTASDSQLWTGTSPTATASVNAIYLNPDVFNSRLALQASIYSLYRFTAIDFEYEPLVASTQAGGCALCVSLDPDTATSKVQSYSQVQEVSPSVKFAFREPARLNYRYNGDELFYNRAVSATSADIRTSFQAVMIGFPSSTSIGAVTMGTLSMRYAIELYGQTVNEALETFMRLSPIQQKVALNAARSAKSDETLGEHKDLMEVPMSRQNTAVSQSTSSATTASSGSIVSGFRAPTVNEQYVLVSSLKH